MLIVIKLPPWLSGRSKNMNIQTIILQSTSMYQAALSLFTSIHETVNMWFEIEAMNTHPLNTSGVMFLKTKSLSVFTDTQASGPHGIPKDSYLFFDLSPLLYKQ